MSVLAAILSQRLLEDNWLSRLNIMYKESHLLQNRWGRRGLTTISEVSIIIPNLLNYLFIVIVSRKGYTMIISLQANKQNKRKQDRLKVMYGLDRMQWMKRLLGSESFLGRPLITCHQYIYSSLYFEWWCVCLHKNDWCSTHTRTGKI